MKLFYLISIWNFISIAFGKYISQDNLYTIPELIQEYHNYLEIEWTAIICRKVTEELDNIIKHIQMTKIIVNDKTKANEVRNNLQRNLMTLAFVGEQEVEEVNEILQRFLKTKHFTNILWIYNKANMQDLWKLSNISWTYGNTKVLYYVRGRIFTFEPLPVIQLRSLSNFQQFAERKDIEDYQKYPITFPILSNSPRCYRYANGQGHMVNTGYMFNIMSIFMKRYNFEFEEYPYYYESYNRLDLYRGLKNKSFDVVLDNLYRHPMLVASDVMWNNKLYLIIPYPKPLDKADYIRYSIKIPILIGTIILLVSVTALFMKTQKSTKKDLIRTALYVFVTLNYQFHFTVKQPKVFKYYVTSLMFFFSLLSTTLFWSSITNLIVLNVFEDKLENFEDVIKSPYQILISQSDYEYMSQLDVLPPILANAKVEANSFVKQHMFGLNTSYIYKALEDRANYMLFQQQHLKIPLMYKLEVTVYCIPMYFPLRYNLCVYYSTGT
ncbi:hypothetical protein FF38_07067 [Lucilia cuprina]|uniref:Ionotropic glutamate receptor C-terminal domain-containing protein n=1 Tax=Lucilia cuprina TaxID=7375 RepID=A0A0L0CHM6_LUCCU|nr:hypothetical protein FF38_07067 [Lucilia cuprina]